MKTSTYSHYYWYAKNWYERGDMIEDLKKIHGYTFDYDAEHVDVNSIVSVLLKLVWYHYFDKDTATGAPKLENAFREFVEDIHPWNNWKVGYDEKTKYDYNEAVIRKCLSMLRLLKVKDETGGDILFLDPLNEKVLPLKKKEIEA